MASRGIHRFAVLTAAATLFLIFAGGLVTSTGSGLAVPDWPLSYGQLMPPMVGGVFYEHGHRMVAATVGMLTLVLAVWIFFKEPRRWVGHLAAVALGSVVLQGLLGGLTVLLLLPTAVSVTHACLAQAFFCMTITLAVVTGPTWTHVTARVREASLRPLAKLSIVAAAAVYCQLILGATMRHTGAGLAVPDFPLMFGRVFPPLASLAEAGVSVHLSHRFGAIVVTVLVAMVLTKVMRHHRNEPVLVVPAVIAGVLVLAQITLGAFTVWTAKGVSATTFHVATGAAVLAACLVLALRTNALAQRAVA